MKKLLLILFCLPLLIMAQAPQGFTYQGVATDNNGFELQNQTISIQASILSSSATGTTVWQETHTTTTDTFGLFNVTIGEGTSTNSGSSATFSEIDWGAASHFMKVEIDVNGGSNYVHVGTSQMMSVPYALYAENVHNLNMDSILGAVYDSINASFSSGAMFVSTFGDTLTMNGQSIIVPGLSYQNVVPTLGSVSDIDGNIYNTIDYGSAGEWMIENLRVTQLNNGTAIPYGLTSGQSTPLYYDFGPGGGYLYNGPAINNNVCPSGWHVPSTQEWEDLFNLFSNNLITIVATQNGWLSYISNTLGDQFITNGTNNSYLSIEYGGKAVPNNALDSGLRGWYWSSSTLFNGAENWTLVFEGDEIELDRITGIDNMQSVRCVKD